MKIHLICIEDGLENVGFRKFSAYVRSIHSDTKAAYVPTGNIYSIINIMREQGAGTLKEEEINAIGKFLGESDIAGICSMTQYSAVSKKIIAATRRINPRTYIIWGGIHAIIHPEDAIKHADAVSLSEEINALLAAPGVSATIQRPDQGLSGEGFSDSATSTDKAIARFFGE